MIAYHEENKKYVDYDEIADFIEEHGVITELNAPRIAHNGTGENEAPKIIDFLKKQYDIDAEYCGTVQPYGSELYYIYDTNRFSFKTINQWVINLNSTLK